MTDWRRLKQVEALGYEFYWSSYYNKAFYRYKVGDHIYVSGPFTTFDDAADAALADHANARAAMEDEHV